MHRLTVMAAVVGLVAAGPALAQQKSVSNVGCGLGSMAWEGESGLAPQVLAATTNGTLGNQTFGITSHTSGCARNGKVMVPERMAMFIGPNMNQLAEDMSRGDGEALATLAYVIGIETQDRAAFYAATQREFARIMPHENVTATEVATSITAVMREDAALNRYADI
ncbi:MAG TPA: DUF3015 domain-containing protein [Candidatus Defluviicoccus seviourii]|nr:DUF3015 domain-containing protein [Defluviicoccus sp.]MDS4073620.1 DUF3015 domain-containing protein [Defluviicoccus sp.]HOT81680.1 DUF3015 domain-containing protein [Candidatus Defluviicoccus seviourii]